MGRKIPDIIHKKVFISELPPIFEGLPLLNQAETLQTLFRAHVLKQYILTHTKKGKFYTFFDYHKSVTNCRTRLFS